MSVILALLRVCWYGYLHACSVRTVQKMLLYFPSITYAMEKNLEFFMFIMNWLCTV